MPSPTTPAKWIGLVVRLLHPIHTSLPPAQVGSAFASYLSGPPRCSRVLRPANLRAAYYPISLLTRVSVIDNEGNAILQFGTYSNRDSMGVLEGDLVPTPGIPMAWSNSVDATDENLYYVSDIVNIRLLRLATTFAATETASLGSAQ